MSDPTSGEEYPVAQAWVFSEVLRREKASLGFYVSGHPLDRHGEDLGRAIRGLTSTAAIVTMAPLARTCVVGMIEEYSEKVFREGGRRSSFILEDQSGRVLVRVPGKMVEPFSSVLSSADVPMLVYGKVVFPAASEEEESVEPEPYLMMDDCVALTEAIRQQVRHVAVRVSVLHCDREKIVEFGRVLRLHPGPAKVRIILRMEDASEAVLVLPDDLSVEATPAFVDAVEKLFGRGVSGS